MHYLEQRGLTRKTIDLWQIGFAPDDFHVLEQALKKKVTLKSGGSIIIESTEAMTVVDVNTGRFIGKTNLESRNNVLD